MINISFAITACNETAELKRLINQLNKCKVDGDEIIIRNGWWFMNMDGF